MTALYRLKSGDGVNLRCRLYEKKPQQAGCGDLLLAKFVSNC
jgi:hypothetical protein